MNDVKKAEQVASPLHITKDLLHKWAACAEGMRWLLGRFPQGGTYCDVQKALRKDNRHGDASWLVNQAFGSILEQPAATVEITDNSNSEAIELIEYTKLEVAVEIVESTAEEMKISGHSAQIGSSGDYAQIGSSGHYAQINAAGKNAVVACAGLGAKAKAGVGGVIALPWFDDSTQRIRMAVGYVGENIKQDTWYSINESGEFIEDKN